MSKKVQQPDEKKPLTKTVVIKRPRRDFKKIFLISSLSIIGLQVVLLLYFKVFANGKPPSQDMYSQDKAFVDRLMAKAELQSALENIKQKKEVAHQALIYLLQIIYKR